MKDARFPQIIDEPIAVAMTVELPLAIRREGGRAEQRFVEFFTANIRNRGTRVAYARAVADFFAWSDQHGVSLQQTTPVVVAAYIEGLTRIYSPPTVKLRLAALRMLFDYLVTGQVIPSNPAASVRGPRHVVKKGSTPVLRADEARQLLDSIDVGSIIGLRDRALIGAMVYNFARVSATVGMNVEDYYPQVPNWPLVWRLADFHVLALLAKQSYWPTQPPTFAMLA